MGNPIARLAAKLVTVLLPRPQKPGPHAAPNPPAVTVTQAPRVPDPYVWSMPNPREARWRRWRRRTQRFPSPGRTPLLLPDEECWQPAVRIPPSPAGWWEATDDVVRLYVLQDSPDP
ncbi:hypothetical protein [Streptomyces sp. SD15]